MRSRTIHRAAAIILAISITLLQTPTALLAASEENQNTSDAGGQTDRRVPWILPLDPLRSDDGANNEQATVAVHDRPRFVPGRIIVKLKEGQSLSSLSKLNTQFGATAVNRLLPERLSLSGRLNVLRRMRAELVSGQSHGRWYWWKDKDSEESKDYEARVAREKALLDRQVEIQEKLVSRVERLQEQGEGAFSNLDQVYVIQVEESEDLTPMIARYNADPAVEYAEPDFLARLHAFPETPPNDTYAAPDGSWTEGAWGQEYEDLWGILKVSAPEAWQTAQGEGVTVAVIDTGVDYMHEDLEANIWTNPGEIPGDGVDNDGNGYVDDVRGWNFWADDNDPMDEEIGHGTHVAGTIAATGNNGLGVVGVAPGAEIMPLKVFSDEGIVEGTVQEFVAAMVSDLVIAIAYAAENGAGVSNNSWGIVDVSRTLQDAFVYAHGLGMTSVASAGNDDVSISVAVPASLETVITVGSTAQDDQRSFFSSFGLAVDVSAPGSGRGRDIRNILSAIPSSLEIIAKREDLIVAPGYARLAGTSMAGPHVAGAAAILLSQYPSASPDEIHARLRLGADSIDSLLGDCAGFMGAGRLNIERALAVESQPLLVLEEYRFKGEVLPGETFELIVRLHSIFEDADGVQVFLEATHPEVAVEEGEWLLGEIASGETAENASDPFRIRLNSGAAFSDEIRFTLRATDSQGETILRSEGAIRLQPTFFQDVAEEKGITFLYSIYSGSWGVTFADVNQDGYADLIASPEHRYLFNPAAGKFEATSVFPRPFWQSKAADIDNDGDLDLLVIPSDEDRPRLLRNSGGGGFADITASSGLPVFEQCPLTPVFFDYDNDGYVDILLPAPPVTLMRNLGNNRFEDVTSRAGLSGAMGYAYANTQVIDFNVDGFMDLIIGAWAPAGVNGLQFYMNQGDGGFRKVCFGIKMNRPSAIAVGDYNNDGFPDFFLAGIWVYKYEGFERIKRITRLYQNCGDGSFWDYTDRMFSEMGGLGVIGPQGAQFLDYDNDGFLDLYLTGGVGGNYLLHNEQGVSFTDRTFESGAYGSNFGSFVAYADYDNDGDLDILNAHQMEGYLSLYENRYSDIFGDPKNHWLKIQLDGHASNSFGLGARVIVAAEGLEQAKTMRNSDDLEESPMHFGLGNHLTADSVVVHWPSGGTTTRSDVSADQTLVIYENPHPWQNPDNPLDINGNGMLTTLDVLILVSAVNSSLGGRLPPGGKLPRVTNEFGPPPYYDVNGDRFLTTLDVLTVIGALNNQAQIASVRTPAQVAEGEEGVFAVSAYDDEDDPITYLWNFGDGITSTRRIARHAYASPGTYPVKLTVTESVYGFTRKTEETRSVRVLPANDPPVIRYFWCGSWWGRWALFYVWATDPDRDRIRYRFDFGDGRKRTKTRCYFWYRYPRRGLYSGSVEAIDSKGGVSPKRRFKIRVR